MTKIAAIGEVMIELSPAGQAPDGKELKALSYAGDTYNTAVTLARLGLDTSYITRIGEDVYSHNVLNALQSERINTKAITHSDTANLGLYMIHNHDDGEREFLYWRDQSAARELFDNNQRNDDLTAFLSDYQWLYFSAISLAILAEPAREKFFEMLRKFKNNGGKIAYDSNYRPQLWSSTETAQETSLHALELSDLALLTLDDEALLWSSQNDALAEAKARYQPLNIQEIVYKRGAEDVVIVRGSDEQKVAVKPIDNIVDTTAAGDTFNAGYMACRIHGGSHIDAAKEGSRCAAVVIQHRGGIIDKTLFLRERDQRGL